MLLTERIELDLLERQKNEALRKLPKALYPKNIDFASNDYLGIIKDRLLTRKFYLEGSSGSRLLSGNSSVWTKLEKKLAAYFQGEDALFFGSGFNANSGLISALTKSEDIVLMDEYVHASFRFGTKFSRCSTYFFKHNCYKHLEKRLIHFNSIKNRHAVIFVIIESLYSMNGSLAPLSNIVELCEQYQAVLILDEAHATGTYGENGEGISVMSQLQNRIPIRIYTFGKAFGLQGAAIISSKTIKNFLINKCIPFIYTTALPPAIGNAIMYFLEQPEIIREKILNLSTLTSYAKNKWPDNFQSHIGTIAVPGNSECCKASRCLLEAGFEVKPIMSPTIQKGKEILRVCLHSFNTQIELDRMFDQINQLI